MTQRIMISGARELSGAELAGEATAAYRDALRSLAAGSEDLPALVRASGLLEDAREADPAQAGRWDTAAGRVRSAAQASSLTHRDLRTQNKIRLVAAGIGRDDPGLQELMAHNTAIRRQREADHEAEP